MYGLETLTSSKQPYMHKYLKLSLHPFYILKGVIGIALDEILFKIYIAVFMALLHKVKDKLILFTILLTMSTSISLLLLTIPFYYGAPNIEYWTIIYFSSRNFVNEPSIYLFSVYLHNIHYPYLIL